MDGDDFAEFLYNAKKKAYSSGIAYAPGRIRGTKEFSFSEGNLKYLDIYSGSLFFLGQELLFEKEIPQWGMVYSGGLIDDSFSTKEVYDFLREALKKMPEDLPLRGNEFFSNSRFIYKNSTDGDLAQFIGYETIEHGENIIYELHYSGGFIE
ncbi:MAG: DUF5680 domain-containing protein [Cuniculiplasma sp.]